ncbi:MAG TPA: PIG-L family deacetylase [Longimicrobiales bacterium]|nr:PIG-L family deacetylase [Longimicrobiales bacterium]
MADAAGLRLTCVVAHPDDESLGFGGTLARYASEGVEVSLVAATRGERGRYGDGSESHPGPDELGRIREAELRAAAEALGVRHVGFLDYRDGELDAAEPVEAAKRIAVCLRELRPHVLLTFDPFGVYGHPDHIAISQLAIAGALRAAAPGPLGDGRDAPHQVQKAYYRAWSPTARKRFEGAFKPLRSTVDGEVRAPFDWPVWSVTTAVAAHDHWEKVWEAVRCHRTQMAQYGPLSELGPEDHRAIWGSQEYYRVFSLVNGGRAREEDLFEGLR